MDKFNIVMELTPTQYTELDLIANQMDLTIEQFIAQKLRDLTTYGEMKVEVTHE